MSSPQRPATAVGARTTARGTVLSTEGWPLPGATVTVLGLDGQQLGRAAAASDGAFAVTGLPPGPVTVLVAAPAHEPHVRTVVVPALGDEWPVEGVRLRRQGAAETPAAGRWTIDTAHSSITATAHHLGLSAVHGRFTAFTGAITVAGDVTRSGVEVSIDAASIDTGNRVRDEHLRAADFLDVAQHPTITYTGSGVERTAAGTWVLRGELRLLGTTRPVALDMTYTGTGTDPWGGTRAAFSATTRLDRDDFRMNWNQAVEVGVAVFGSTLKVAVDVEAVREA
ncbi:YceI family protein [Kineococcus glutinatus]|uniref:YceI family protein n=1 Tax=Kineococcus glutinatus TaxID=1070872 RepID=A0ABP9HAF6_9ACTN